MAGPPAPGRIPPGAAALPALRNRAAFSSGDKKKHSTRHCCRIPARFFCPLLFEARTASLSGDKEKHSTRHCCRIPARFFCPLLFELMPILHLVKQKNIVQDTVAASRQGFLLLALRTSGVKKKTLYKTLLQHPGKVFLLPALRTSSVKKKHCTRHCCSIPARFFCFLLFEPMPLFHLVLNKNIV
jgi:hypothetical protein